MRFRNSWMHFALAACAVVALCLGVYLLSGDVAHASGVVGAATVLSAQMTRTSDDQIRNYPIDRHGKMRATYFYYKNETGGTLADGQDIDLNTLPPGRVRVLPNLSRYRTTAMGASRVLNIGHRAYVKDQSATGAVAENTVGFVAAKDVSGAVTDVAFDGGAALMKIDLYSIAGITVCATITGGTIPANGIIEGYLTYLYE